ncbi:septal ring lytic transglycosylase RlpA family protein [Aliikangiella marina]|uniref:Endolytic peptidoglycan transglycosylase RlpA n=1 Tax=Aliikangiella marina TaxID=1712262 RepID=A0A545T9T7_9GAMM|nr:septal ring lytic transglycosylase RlpA family protein [Aliikangiella marina]TQV73976.1 septal ring lytic transglycosylase RlpA family protein [Aliikangiella marina]
MHDTQLLPINRYVIGILTVLLLSGCVSLFEEKDAAPVGGIDWARVKQVTPKPEPRSRYGNPPSYEQNGITYTLLASADNYKQKGVASWYGTKFHGRRTSSGETYDMFKMTAAHKTLPIPVYARVRNLDNGKEIVVKINDRGPFAKNRIIDLSYAAAHELGMAEAGTANVEVETISFSESRATRVARSEQPTDSDHNHANKKRYVQVGAYSNHKTAQKLAKVLDREIRLPVKITSVWSNKKKLYRVRIGPVPSQQTAEELVATLDIKELGKPKIVYQ